MKDAMEKAEDVGDVLQEKAEETEEAIEEAMGD